MGSGAVLEFGLHRQFKAIFDEVQRSNMSKACATLEEGEATAAHYKATQGVDAEIQEVSGKFLVYRLPDKKVLKSVKYSPAQLQFLVAEHVVEVSTTMGKRGDLEETPEKQIAKCARTMPSTKEIAVASKQTSDLG